jgi:hypothetical protein
MSLGLLAKLKFGLLQIAKLKFGLSQIAKLKFGFMTIATGGHNLIWKAPKYESIQNILWPSKHQIILQSLFLIMKNALLENTNAIKLISPYM